MNFFQMLIEFSKLTDLEKKYLSEAVPRYADLSFVIKDFKRPSTRDDLTEVEKSLVDKGWLRYLDNNYSIDMYNANRIEVDRYYRDFFRKIQHWE